MGNENNENKIKSESKSKKSGKKRLNMDLVNRRNAYKWLPFILYLSLWAVIYIANRHYAEKTELKINDLQKNLKEYRAEYLTIKSELMFKTKQSEVAKMVDSIGLHQLRQPPEKLKVEKGDK